MIRIWLVAAGIACGVLVMSVGSTQLADMRAQIATLPGMAWLKAETARGHTATDADREFQFQSFANSLPGSVFTHLSLRVRSSSIIPKLEFLVSRPRHGLFQRTEC